MSSPGSGENAESSLSSQSRVPQWMAHSFSCSTSLQPSGPATSNLSLSSVFTSAPLPCVSSLPLPPPYKVMEVICCRACLITWDTVSISKDFAMENNIHKFEGLGCGCLFGGHSEPIIDCFQHLPSRNLLRASPVPASSLDLMVSSLTFLNTDLGLFRKVTINCYNVH